MILAAENTQRIDSEEEISMQKQLQLIRNRRIKERPINGSAEIFLEVSDNHPQKKRLIEILDDIENAELGILEVTKISDQRPK